jgi:Spy/CpxP family protein refolding chaperone
MKTKYGIVVLMVAVVALLMTIVPVPAFSQMEGMSMGEHSQRHGQMMEADHMEKMMSMCIEHADHIGLTDDQIEKAKPVLREMQKKHARFKADLKIAQIDIMEILDVKDFDLEKANSAVKKIEEIRTAHHLEMLKALKEIRTILTDDQFKKIQKIKRMVYMEKGKKKLEKKMMKK